MAIIDDSPTTPFPKVPATRFASFLRALARLRNLSHAEIGARVARLAPMRASRSNVGRWFTGQVRPGEPEIRALASVLGVHADAMFAICALEDDARLGVTSIATALSAWPLMATGHETTLLLAGATMLTGLTQLRTPHRDLRATTLVVSTLDDLALADYERSLTAGARDSAFLRASWLSAVELLLDLATAADGPHVRLWLRPAHAISPWFDGAQIVANDWMLIESSSANSANFHWRTFGEPSWTGAADLLDELRTADRNSCGRVIFDSQWPNDEPRRAAFAAYRGRIARQIAATCSDDSLQEDDLRD